MRKNEENESFNMKISKDSNKNWKNNAIQFPRLIAELDSAGGFTEEVSEYLCESMDVTMDELDDIVSRAQEEWDKIKEKTPR